MSDALAYLVKARPDAVGHSFAFLKACGTHLDPKTRNLISVITKVDSQTERGFKQYLGRALREGCTPMEVLDALLMAFPTLGLAKIVWAVDIILAMDLPEFQPGALGAKGDALALKTTSQRHIAGAATNPLEAALKYRNEEQGAVDGNTVNMDVERSAFAENSVHYQASLTFINGMLTTMQRALQNQ